MASAALAPTRSDEKHRRYWWTTKDIPSSPSAQTMISDEMKMDNAPVEVTLEQVTKLLDLKLVTPVSTSISAASCSTTTTVTPNNKSAVLPPKAVASRSPVRPTTIKSKMKTSKDVKQPSKSKLGGRGGGGWLRRRFSRPSPPIQLPQPVESSSSPPETSLQYQQQRPPSLVATTTAISEKKESLALLDNPIIDIPEMLTLEDILQREVPPPALMDDTTSVASMTTVASALSDIADPISLDQEDDDDGELHTVAANSTNNVVGELSEDPVMSKRWWWERWWEMIDPEDSQGDAEEETTELVDMETSTFEEPQAGENIDPEPSLWWWMMTPGTYPSSSTTTDEPPIRPPSRGILDVESVDETTTLESAFDDTVVEEPNEALTQHHTVDKEEIEDDVDVTSSVMCPHCGLPSIIEDAGNAIDPTVHSRAENPEIKATGEEELTDEEADSLIADHLSVILERLDRNLFPWMVPTESNNVKTEPLPAISESQDATTNNYVIEDASLVPPNPCSAQFTDDAHDDEDIREMESVTKSDKPPTAVQMMVFSQFLDWLATVDATNVSTSDTHDALCQPINPIPEEEPESRACTFSFDPMIPEEIRFLNCTSDVDDTTVITLDSAFRACFTPKNVEEPKKTPRFLFRRAAGAPFLKKAPVNKERAKQELDIARAMWRHYKKSKEMRDSINDLKKLAERQQRNEEFAAAVAAHRKLRQCNHVNCNCHQERW